jgi:hypothetical protein
MALVASFLATYVYYASLEEDEDAVMKEGDAWMLVGGLSGLWVSFFFVFLLLMKSKFRATFFSLQTGHSWVKSFFLDHEEDRIKMFLHGQNRKLWASIREDVKAYTLDNWERWEEEKPEWFNDAWKAGVDDDMIPPASLGRLNGGASERRRSSLGDLLGGRAGGSVRVAPIAGGGGQP